MGSASAGPLLSPPLDQGVPTPWEGTKVQALGGIHAAGPTSGTNLTIQVGHQVRDEFIGL